MEQKRLYKSTQDRAIFGVCGGFAEYFGVDSLVVRLLFVLSVFVYGFGPVIYLIAALVMPQRGDEYGMAYAGAQAGTYSADGMVYVNRASYAQPAGQDFARMESFDPHGGTQDSPAHEAAEDETFAQDAPKESPRVYAQEPSPQRPQQNYQAYGQYQQPRPSTQQYYQNPRPHTGGDNAVKFIGVVLILIGVMTLIKVFVPHFDSRILFGTLAILAGGLLLARKH